MDAPPGSYCSVRGQGGERRRGQVTLCGASDGCQIRTLGAMGRDAGEDTGMETTAAQRLRSTAIFYHADNDGEGTSSLQRRAQNNSPKKQNTWRGLSRLLPISCSTTLW